MRAIRMFGQTRPLLIDEDGAVLAGNGLWEALKRLEWPTAQAFRIKGLTEADKAKLMLSDNKVFELGVDDYEAIRELLHTLPDYDVPGFDTEVLRRLNAEAGDLAETYVDGFGRLTPDEITAARNRTIPEGSTEPDTTALPATDDEPAGTIAICPHCGGRFRLAA